MKKFLISIFTFTGILVDILIILFLIAGNELEVTQTSTHLAMIASAMLTFKLMKSLKEEVSE